MIKYFSERKRRIFFWLIFLFTAANGSPWAWVWAVIIVLDFALERGYFNVE